MYPSHNQGLRYSVDRMEIQPLHLSLNNPPFVPESQYPGEQWVRDVLPLVSAATAIEIQNRAQTNPLRMFMFNMYAQNGFRNADFNSLVCGIIDYLVMAARKNMYRGVDEALADVIPKMVEMACAINVRLFPELGNVLDYGAQSSVRELINQFDSVINEINMFKDPRSRMGVGMGMGMGGGMGMANQGVSRMGGWDSRASVPRSTLGGGTSLFDGGRQSTAPVNSADRFARSVVEQPFTKERVQETTMTAAADVDFTEPVITEWKAGNKWKFSINNPYFLAFNPNKHKLSFTVQDNALCPILSEINPMDYEKHSVQTIFGTPPKGMVVDKTGGALGAVFDGIKNLSNETALINTDDFDDETCKNTKFACVFPETIGETCVASAWFTGSLYRLTAKDKDGNLPYAYRTYVNITEPIICPQDSAEFVTDLSKSRTFIELREKLSASAGEVGQELWVLCNKRATDMVNSILKLGMSISTIIVESFVNDIQDLINLLEKKYGSSIKDAFLSNQRKQIETIFSLAGENTAAILTANYLDSLEFADGALPNILHFSNDFSFTYLNCLSYELELELAPDVGCAISSSLTPVIHDLVTNLFEDIDSKGYGFTKHFIRTNDGRILEVGRGQVGEGVYVIMLVS